MNDYTIIDLFDPSSPHYNGAVRFPYIPPSAQNSFLESISPQASIESLKDKGAYRIASATITVDTLADLQHALNLIGDIGGGTVFLESGTYLLTADISIPGGVTIQGVSRDGVIINCNTSYKIKIAGSNVYSTGTVTINNGDTTVVGSSTVWTSAMVGRYIYLDGIWYKITVRTDDTHITIADAYTGVNLSASAYAIATINFNSTMRKLTVTNATASGVVVSHAMEPNIDDLVIDSCGTGLDLDYVQFPQIFAAANESGVNFDMNYVSGFKVDFCEFSDSTTGAGVVMTNCQNATMIDSEVARNTGNGMSLTSCKKITFFSLTVDDNNAKGIELVSGNSDIQFLAVGADSNISDGYKLTATDDNIIVTDSVISNNGGYGINIAVSTCDNAIISGNDFITNTSGAVNDSGVGTVIRGNVGQTDNAASSFGVTQSMTAGATINGATLPVPVYIKNSDSRVYACDANASGALKFFGFAVSNSTAGNSINVKITGVVSGFSGLTVSLNYYVSDTVGTVSTTPGTLQIPVGIAVSATEILIINQSPGGLVTGTSAFVISSADTERTDVTGSYVKKKEIEVAEGGTYRVSFDLKTDNAADAAFGRVYKNGVAFGTEQSTTSTTYVTKTADLAFVPGDLVQLYIHRSGSSTALTQNFRLALYGRNPTLVVTD